MQSNIPNQLIPHPSMYALRLAASSKAIQQNGKLNFKERQSMGTEAYLFSQRKCISVHSSSLAAETRLTLLWPLEPGEHKCTNKFTQMHPSTPSTRQMSWLIATEVKVYRTAAEFSVFCSISPSVFTPAKSSKQSV